MNKSNREKVRINKITIVRRLQAGERLMSLCREYHVAYYTKKEAILRVLTETQFRAITKSHWAHGGKGELESQVQSIEQRKAAASPPPRIIWMCSSCGHTYNGDCPPIQCDKCNRGGFEKNILPQRMNLLQLVI